MGNKHSVVNKDEKQSFIENYENIIEFDYKICLEMNEDGFHLYPYNNNDNYSYASSANLQRLVFDEGVKFKIYEVSDDGEIMIELVEDIGHDGFIAYQEVDGLFYANKNVETCESKLLAIMYRKVQRKFKTRGLICYVQRNMIEIV